MALSRTNILSEQSATNILTAGFTTSAQTTTAGQWLVVIGKSVSGTAISAANMTIADSKGNVYTSRLTFDQSGWGADDAAIRVWTAPVTSAGSTTWTIGAGADSTDQYCLTVLSYAGANTTGFGASASNANSGINGALTLTLGTAPAPSSDVIGVFLSDNSGAGVPTQTPGATFTELFNVGTAGHAGSEIEVRTNSQSTSVDWVDINDTANVIAASIAIAFEVLAAAGVGWDPRSAARLWHPQSPRRVLRPIFPVQGATAAPATNAPAECATGTGTAFNATVTIGAQAGIGTSTGAANNATVNIGAQAGAATGTGAALNAGKSISVAAGIATGTGAALNATPNIGAQAGLAAGTGTAYNTSEAVSVSAGLATGTGAAYNPTPNVSAQAGLASGTGTAYNATVSTASATNAPAGVATGTGTAYNPTVAIGATAGLAASTGTAYNPTASDGVKPTTATGAGTANNPTPAIAVNAGLASGTGTAYNATVSTSGSTNAPAGLATGTGTAYNASVAIGVKPTAATGTGTAYNASVFIGAQALLAAGTGAANNAKCTISVNAGTATGVGQAYNPFGGSTVVVKPGPALAGRDPLVLRGADPAPVFGRDPGVNQGTDPRPVYGRNPIPRGG